MSRLEHTLTMLQSKGIVFDMETLELHELLEPELAQSHAFAGILPASPSKIRRRIISSVHEHLKDRVSDCRIVWSRIMLAKVKASLQAKHPETWFSKYMIQDAKS